MLSPPPGDRPSRDPISSIPAALSMISGAYAWAATSPIPLAGAATDAHARPDTAGKTHQDRGSSAFVPAAGKTPAARALDVRGRRAFVFPIGHAVEIRPDRPCGSPSARTAPVVRSRRLRRKEACVKLEIRLPAYDQSGRAYLT